MGISALHSLEGSLSTPPNELEQMGQTPVLLCLDDGMGTNLEIAFLRGPFSERKNIICISLESKLPAESLKPDISLH